MTRMVLIRHGQARGYVDRIVAGHDACKGLSEHGRVQAIALRDRLLASRELAEASALYASVMPRAAETAAIISDGVGTGTLDVRTDCGLCEMHPGEADGMSWDAYAERWPFEAVDPDRTTVGPAGSESIDAFVGRVATSLERLATEHRGEMVVVACHGGVVNCALEALTGIRFGSLTRYVENTSITEWRFDEDAGRWWLVRLNDAGHVPQASF